MMRSSRQASPIAVIIFSLVFVIGGFFAMKYGQKSIAKAKASLEWPTVPGSIVMSDVSRDRDSDGDVTYAAEIAYKYVVNGESYESNQRRIGGKVSSSSSKGAYKVVKQYPKGTPVTVSYHPDAPEDAVIEPGVFMESKILFYIGIAFFVIGLLMAGSMIRKVIQPERN